MNSNEWSMSCDSRMASNRVPRMIQEEVDDSESSDWINM